MAALTVYGEWIISTFLFISILLMHLGISSCSGCQPLDEGEVQALRDAAGELGKADWITCRDDPCTNSTAETCWFKKDPTKPLYLNQVFCGCLDNQWHVTEIYLKGQNLAGSVPKSLAKIPYLKKIDLFGNLLHGRIPEEWASMKNLIYLSFAINQLSGQIPKYLGDITSLTYISFESNQLAGGVPAELGNLVKLTTLILSDNNLTGKLPEDLKKLGNLTELRLSSNNFSGSLPDFFDSWRKLEKLEIQGSGFEGPIPRSISLLKNVAEIRISDLNGEGSKFPSLPSFTRLPKLVLRNCNISGRIPNDIAKIQWKILDLSFNKLEGQIPTDSIYAQQMYLSHNNLTGTIPSWINYVDRRLIDLSYNSFDERSDIDCDKSDNINLYRSFSKDRNLESIFCLKKTPCSGVRRSLHINCGGEEVKLGKITYEGDNKPGGAVKFFGAAKYWGFSSSGDYWNTDDSTGYTKKDNSNVNLKDSQLCADARYSATYLTYYGLCLKGNYTVTLLFYEIFFTNDSSFSSLGRRKFDIYMQDKLVCKDFDVVANGSHMPVRLVFNNIQVNGTIDIRLYYAGKGSTAIPDRVKGVYGPLISAISVDTESKTPFEKKKVLLFFIGAAFLLLCVVMVALALFRRKRCREGMPSGEEDLRGLDLHTGLFTFRQIRAATNNFDAACKIGEGGFGSVYLGTLLDGTHIAVKQLSSRSSEANRDFVNEIGIISGLRHPNLVRLYGCCVEGSQLFLIYEYMENNNLAHALFGDDQVRLDWHTRQRICIGVARGLTYLHEESAIKIIHRDIKATNILLDRDLNAKISDFGLARLHEEQNTHISTRIAGTIGYMSPEYALWGYLTYKADVYSFGVVLLEIVAGRSSMKQPDEKHFCLLDKALVLQQKKQNLIELVDPRLGTEYNEEEALTMIKVALLCTNPSPALRPTTSEVLSMLEGSLIVPESYLDPNMQSHDWLYQASRMQHDQMSEKETQSLIVSSFAPTDEGSSKSSHDLYPVNHYSC